MHPSWLLAPRFGKPLCRNATPLMRGGVKSPNWGSFGELLKLILTSYRSAKYFRLALGGHPKPASQGHLKTGQL